MDDIIFILRGNQHDCAKCNNLGWFRKIGCPSCGRVRPRDRGER